MSRLKLLAFFAVPVICSFVPTANSVADGNRHLGSRSAEDEYTLTAGSHTDLLQSKVNSAKIYSNDNGNLNNVGLDEIHENTGPVLNGPNVCTKHEE